MGTDERRRQYEVLCGRAHRQKLTDELAAELARLTRQLCEAEAACLAAANEWKAQEIAVARAAVERLEAENRQLREYLSERRRFLERVRAIASQLEAEDQELRERFASILARAEKPAAPASS